MKSRAEGLLSRPTGRLLVFVWAALLLGAVGAKAAPVKTMVQDTLYRANGQVAQGMLTIRWNAFSTSAGEAVPAGQMTASIAGDGSIAIPLIPNTGSIPSGSYYKVVVKLSDGTASEEQWVVPAVTSTTVAAVRANVVPQAVAAQFVGRDYVDTALAAVVPASLVHLAGAETIIGAKVFTVSPEVPAVPADAGAAVARGYVDQQFGGLATVATTGSYNDLLNKPAGSNLSSPGAIGASTPGTVNATAYSVNGVPLASGNLSDGSTLAKTGQANTFSQPQTAQHVITAATPMTDIRAYGAVVDGATDIGSALTSAIAQACTTSGVVYLPCGGNGCYLANGTGLAVSGTNTCANSKIVQVKVQGTLKVGTTLVVPDGMDIVGDGGGSYVQWQGVGAAAAIQGQNTSGTMGTTFAAGTQTFTPSSMTGIVPGAAITVAGTSSCTISSVARASNVVTATLSGSCRVPPGASATVSGVTDSSFNGTFFVADSDYGLNTISWTQTASNASSSGGTLVGLNEDSIETVAIASTTSTTATATFNRAHNSADQFGVVVVATKNQSFGHKSMQNMTVNGCGGACIWTNYSVYGALINVGAGASQIMTSVPLVLSTTSSWRIDKGTFLAATGHTNPGLPWGIMFTETASVSGDETGIIDVSDTVIVRGVKFDSGGYTRGQLANGIKFKHTTFERAAAGVRLDPRNVHGLIGMIDLDDTWRQDNLDGFLNPCAMVYTDFSHGLGGMSLKEYPGVSGCMTGKYFDGNLRADVQPNSVTLPSNPTSPIGTLHDGKTTETELRGEGADMHPALVPYATANIPDPTTWTSGNCTVTQGAAAPDGSTTAVALGNSSWQSVGSLSIASVGTGDYILYGAWVKPNGTLTAQGQSGQPFYLGGSSAVPFADAPIPYQAYPSNFQTTYNGDFWTPVVAVAKFQSGDNLAHTISYNAMCPVQMWGPFMMYLPASTPVEEVERTRQQLLHGYVPPNMPAGQNLAVHPAHKFYWGSDTNLYRGAAGVVQTDGSFNVNSASGSYQMNGNAVLPHTMTGYTGAGVTAVTAGTSGSPTALGYIATGTQMPGCGAGTYMKADGSGCATPSGSGTVTGTGTAGKLTEWAIGGAGIQDSPISDSGTALSSTEPITVSGMPAGCTQLPCVVAKVESTTSGSLYIAGAITHTPSSAGEFRFCAYTSMTVAGTGGAVGIQGSFTEDGHALNTSVIAMSTVNTQWSNAQGCVTLYSDASQQIIISTVPSAVTGSPTLRYAITLERLQ